jgi:heparan-alpha-glucosaminide N-acetyltransferase
LYYPSRREVEVARIKSIDLLRGMDVLLMLFVNEVAGVPDAPAFLHHKAATDDGMTITDLVFPAFLFIVGMAVPFALGSRLRRGESRLSVLKYVLARAFALVVAGVFMVNAENGQAGWLSLPAWNALMLLGVLLVWAVPRDGWGRGRWVWLRAAGVLLLVFLAIAYQGRDVSGWLQMRHHWWGILGLIGWAYLGVASLYLVTGPRPAVLTALVALYGCVAIAAGYVGSEGWPVYLYPLVGGVVGTHGLLVLAGCLLGVMLQRRDQAEPRSVWRFAGAVAAMAGALAAAGLLLHGLNGLHPVFTISKIRATVPWGLVCAALTCAAWLVVFLIADVLGWSGWPTAIRTAGENPLLAYVLAPLVLSLFELLAPFFGGVSPYERLREPLALGLTVAALFSWAMVRLAGWLRTLGLRFQL